MNTLEGLLRMEVDGVSPVTKEPIKFSPAFRVSVQEVKDTGVRIIIHAYGHNSDTLDFWVQGNCLTRLE